MKKYFYKIRPWLLSKADNLRYSKEYYYTRIFHKYDRLEAYLALYRKCRTQESFKTASVISFLDGLRSGAGIKEVVSMLPTVRHDILNNEALPVKVVFYKMLIGEYRVKCHIHFFDGKMFLCSYTFSNLKEGDPEKITATLQKKYLPDVAGYSGQVIADPDGNCIYVEKGVELSINYLSLQDGMSTEMQRFCEEQERKQEKRVSAGETEVFNSL